MRPTLGKNQRSDDQLRLCAYDMGYKDQCLGMKVDNVSDEGGNIRGLARFAVDGQTSPLLAACYWSGWVDAREERVELLTS